MNGQQTVMTLPVADQLAEHPPVCDVCGRVLTGWYDIVLLHDKLIRYGQACQMTLVNRILFEYDARLDYPGGGHMLRGLTP